MARGIPVAAHSRHSIRVASSRPSAPEMTKRAASAALSPARTSPTKSGLPGVSMRLTTTSPLAKLAAARPGRGHAVIVLGAPPLDPGRYEVLEERALAGTGRSDEDNVADVARAGGRGRVLGAGHLSHSALARAVTQGVRSLGEGRLTKWRGYRHRSGRSLDEHGGEAAAMRLVAVGERSDTLRSRGRRQCRCAQWVSVSIDNP